MRAELRDAVSGLFASLELPNRDTLNDDAKQRLVTLAGLVTMARSPVERDRVSRDIELIPDPEAPARFALMPAALPEGLELLGLESEQGWRLVTKTAFDSMPTQRRRLLELLAAAGEMTTKQAALELGLPTTTARRTLEETSDRSISLIPPSPLSTTLQERPREGHPKSSTALAGISSSFPRNLIFDADPEQGRGSGSPRMLGA